MSFKMNGLVLPMSGLSKVHVAVCAAVMAAGAGCWRRSQPPPAPALAGPPRLARSQGRRRRGAARAPVPGNPDYQPPQPRRRTGSAAAAAGDVGRRRRAGPARLHRADRRRGAEPGRLRSRRACRRQSQAGDPLALSRRRRPTASTCVSSDLALGHVQKAGAVDWFVVDNDLDAAKQDALLRSALATHRIARRAATACFRPTRNMRRSRRRWR